jgi:hypothetical protein
MVARPPVRKNEKSKERHNPQLYDYLCIPRDSMWRMLTLGIYIHGMIVQMKRRSQALGVRGMRKWRWCRRRVWSACGVFYYSCICNFLFAFVLYALVLISWYSCHSFDIEEDVVPVHWYLQAGECGEKHFEPWPLSSDGVSADNIPLVGNQALKVFRHLGRVTLGTKHRLTLAISKPYLRASDQKSSGCEPPRRRLKLIILTHLVRLKDSIKTHTLTRSQRYMSIESMHSIHYSSAATRIYL